MTVMVCLACNCPHVDTDVDTLYRAIFGDDIVAKSPQKFIDPHHLRKI
jgi:hypothetical protein